MRQKQRKDTRIYRVIRMSPAVILALLLTSAWGLYSWNTLRRQPALVQTSEPVSWVTHNLSLGYGISVADSRLYPGGRDLGTDVKRIPMRLVTRAWMELHDRISSWPGTVESGSYSVSLVLKASDLWAKQYALVPDTPIEKGQTQIKERFSVPLGKVFDDMTEIQKETGVSSITGRYDLELRFKSRVILETGEPYDAVSTFVFGLSTGGHILEAPVELTQSRRLTRESHVEKPNIRIIAGRTITVHGLASLVLASSLAGLALLSALLVWKSRISGKLAGTAVLYQDRFVEIENIDASRITTSVELRRLEDLIQISDDTDSPVFRYSGNLDLPSVKKRQAAQDSNTMILVHGGVLYYCYTNGLESPQKAAAETA